MNIPSSSRSFHIRARSSRRSPRTSAPRRPRRLESSVRRPGSWLNYGEQQNAEQQFRSFCGRWHVEKTCRDHRCGRNRCPLRFEHRRLTVCFQRFVVACGGVTAAMAESFHLAAVRGTPLFVRRFLLHRLSVLLDRTTEINTWIFAGSPSFDHHDVGGPQNQTITMIRGFVLSSTKPTEECAA